MQQEFIYLKIMFQLNTYDSRKDKYYKLYLDVPNGASTLILTRLDTKNI